MKAYVKTVLGQTYTIEGSAVNVLIDTLGTEPGVTAQTELGWVGVMDGSGTHHFINFKHVVDVKITGVKDNE